MILNNARRITAAIGHHKVELGIVAFLVSTIIQGYGEETVRPGMLDARLVVNSSDLPLGLKREDENGVLGWDEDKDAIEYISCDGSVVKTLFDPSSEESEEYRCTIKDDTYQIRTRDCDDNLSEWPEFASDKEYLNCDLLQDLHKAVKSPQDNRISTKPAILAMAILPGKKDENGGQPRGRGGYGGKSPANPFYMCRGQFNEAPLMAQLVSNGMLPPVDERLPETPIMRHVVDEIGAHGGSLIVPHRDFPMWREVTRVTGTGPHFFRQNLDGTFGRGLITDYAQSPDDRSIILDVRRGMHWSDGDRIDAEDFVFAFNNMYLNSSMMWKVMGSPVEKAQQLSEYRFSVAWRDPVPNIVIDFAGPVGSDWIGVQPAHYLKAWHVDYNEDALRMAQEEGFDTWKESFLSHYWGDSKESINKPTISPWKSYSYDGSNRIMTRNPFYMFVDSGCNQLPYLDKIIFASSDIRDFDDRETAFLFGQFDDYKFLSEGRGSDDNIVTFTTSFYGSEMGLQLNWNTSDQMKSQLFENHDFRNAISMAIDRETINMEVYSMYADVYGGTPFVDHSTLVQADYDPIRADALLDQIGLVARDRDGFRLSPSGIPIVLSIYYEDVGDSDANRSTLELVEDYWEQIGIRTSLSGYDPKVVSRATMMDSADVVVTSYAALMQHLAQGEELPMWREQDDRQLYQARRRSVWSGEYRRFIYQIADEQAKNLFWIGIVGPVPVVAQNRVGNVMTQFAPRHVWTGGLSEFADQLYLKDQ